MVQRNVADLTEAEVALLPPASAVGPAMRKLEPREQLFVMCVANQGSRQNFKRAAIAAGYTGNSNALKQRAYRMAHDERVQEAILEVARKDLATAAIAGVGVVRQAMADKKVPMRVRLVAAGMAMDRAGLPVVTEQRVSVTREMSREEKLRTILDYAKMTGQDPRVLLGSAADAVEGDFKVLGIERLPDAAPAAATE